MDISDFKEQLWDEGRNHFRPMPWREDTRPYYVLVSELMLQQTQVVRVIPKFEAFIATFPDVATLAGASLGDVLKLWQGLGYNRRAKYLHDSAKMLVKDFDGIFPNNEIGLTKLAGVGKNTAGALMAYAFNQPVVFIETNIRTVYIHHFFNDNFAVDDKDIIIRLAETLDREHPREFYWALMDYGSWLKSQGIRNISQSKHYKKQSAIRGSVRETRGQIVRQLSDGEQGVAHLKHVVAMDDRFEVALDGLVRDGLIERFDDKVHLTK